MSLVPSFDQVLQSLAPVMTVPTFQSFTILVAGWLFAHGLRIDFRGGKHFEEVVGIQGAGYSFCLGAEL